MLSRGNPISHQSSVTTNDAEGFFGLIKNEIEHDLQYLNRLYRILLNNGDRLYLDSLKLTSSMSTALLLKEEANLLELLLQNSLKKNTKK
ncbi:MAG: hypothetical protein K2I49_02105 [Ureaplasma sp.]|nr:hypothetical protein [Ureaplasma sp.]